MGFADLHLHTTHSYDGTCSVAAVLKYVADYTDINVVAVTDHNSINGNEEAQRLAPDYGLQVIPGCEISTSDGHLLALFIRKFIPPRLSLVETLDRLGEQGGVAIAPHPGARGTSALSFEVIRQALDDADLRSVLVGIEAYNGGLVYTDQNDYVEARAAQFPLAQCGNSDAHMLEMIGQGKTWFPGNSVTELVKALRTGDTRVSKHRTLSNARLLGSYFPRLMLRKMGWITHHVASSPRLSYVREMSLSA